MEYAKYIKYKNKYLNLLNQKAGSDFYLPCEITHYTSTAYYSKNNIEIPKHITNSIDTISYDYIQDNYIQLYNGLSYKTIVTSEMERFMKPLFFNPKNICNAESCTCSYYNLDLEKQFTNTFCKDEEIPNIYKKCTPRKSTNIIYTRIGNNTFSNDEYIGVEYKINDKNIIIREQSKGGNYVSAPNNTIFYIDGTHIIIDEILKINKKLNCVELKCNFKSVNNTFRHIDEIMCFMPYGKDKYKIWFYNEFTSNHFNLMYSNEKICELNIERLENLNKISQALFGQSFENSQDNFVFFDFYIWAQSIFNRTWYEQIDKCICLFPNLVPNIKSLNNQQLIDNLITNVKNEMKKVKSYIDDKIPTYIFIGVKEANSEKPEGTLHCMIKQRFVKVE